jgi:ParB-like nuclease domain
MSADIRNIDVDKIDANPWRNLATYPPIPHKVEALKNSIKQVGMWPAIIVRPNPARPGRYQQAFGHQRRYAAIDLKLKQVPVIVMDLTDEQMLQYLGRENGEDYSAEYLVMLNTWEAGHVFLFRAIGRNPEPVEIARLLGWMRISHRQTGDHEVMSDVANACSNGMALIKGSHLARPDLEGLTVSAASDIVGRAVSRMATIEQAGKLQKVDAAEISHAKRVVGNAARQTARDVKEGKIAKRDISRQVDVNTLEAAGKVAKQGKLPPLFTQFCQTLVEVLAKTLNGDSLSERLRQIAEVLEHVIEPEDRAALRKVTSGLDEVANRARDWSNRLDREHIKPFPAAQIGGPKHA